MPKHKPPSRIRYEKKHPTISFRVDLETKQRLKKVLEKQSVASFIKEALGEREREKKSLEYAHDKGYSEGVEEGYDQGYDDAVRVYGVYTHCAICGEKILIDREEEKKDIDMYLRDMPLCHTRCIKKKKRERMEYPYKWHV